MRSIVTLPLAAALLAAASAHATVAAKRDFPDLVARAEQIVVGTVVRLAEEDGADGVRRTLVTLADLSVLKGQVDGVELTLRFLGGSKGEYAARVLDFPQFRDGERAVLFIAGNGRSVCPLVGVWQGRLRVRFDAERGTEVIESDDGRRVLGLDKRDLRYAARNSEANQPALSLDDFRGMIADEIAHPTVR